MTSRYQCTKLFTEKLQKKRGTYPYKSMDSIALLSRRELQELVFHIAAPPCALMAISPGHHPTPFRHTTRTVRWKRKFTFYLGTASSGTSSIPLPATYSRHISKLTLHHHAKQQLTNADTKVRSKANSRHCIRRVINFFFPKNINAPISDQTAAVKKIEERIAPRALSTFISVHTDAADLAQPAM
ncbi:hypothetical protein AVEN_113357-1 [Araneus ventricosus]|uniref:Uncharacterized protein n=1 Tax=Araneus ventricosus TaxID=182803 RepID=A0A4Y2T621_ARAVE|nr:hypothetical protein AVEN_10736-1 [Araneus ventricosus]GBN74332.1 hypothetical protein AVEN_172112-1 [Araneus ventricosus]GBN96012.1 hypothetical protein AVEN_63909-1 [Araneus ventricosus]GBN96017.1 hypothetical protein AVEN_113357-1 [Araneus ventricosus]